MTTAVRVGHHERLPLIIGSHRNLPMAPGNTYRPTPGLHLVRGDETWRFADAHSPATALGTSIALMDGDQTLAEDGILREPAGTYEQRIARQLAELEIWAPLHLARRRAGLAMEAADELARRGDQAPPAIRKGGKDVPAAIADLRETAQAMRARHGEPPVSLIRFLAYVDLWEWRGPQPARAGAALRAWAAGRAELDDRRDRLVRVGLAVGFTKTEIHAMTGISRATIDRILAAADQSDTP